MLLQRWLDLWPKARPFADLVSGILTTSGYRASVQGVDHSAGRFMIAGLAKHCRLPTLVITSDTARAEKIYEDILAFFPSPQVHLLLSRELFVAGDLLTQSVEQLGQRLHFLNWASSGSQGIYIAPIGAVLNRAVPPKYWCSLNLELYPGQQMDRDYLLSRLTEIGYNRVPLIEAKGQFSVRGEIIDIYPPDKEQPVRVEMFEDTISSLRTFNYQSQRSTGAISKINIKPAFELILTPDKYREGESGLRKEAGQAVARLRRSTNAEMAARLQQKIDRHLTRLAEPGGLEIYSTYFSYFYGPGASLLDYLFERSLIVLDEPAQIIDSGARLREELEDHCRNCFLQGELLPGQLAPVFNERELLANIPWPVISMSLFSTGRLLFQEEKYNLEVSGVPY